MGSGRRPPPGISSLRGPAPPLSRRWVPALPRAGGRAESRCGRRRRGRGRGPRRGGRRAGHVVRVAAAAAASVRAGRGSAAPSHGVEVSGGRGGAGRWGGAAGPRAGPVGGERRRARPGCRGYSAQEEPASRSALQPRALEHLPGGNGDKGGFMSKGKEAGRAIGARREAEAAAPASPAGDATGGGLKRGGAHARWHPSQDARAWRNAQTGRRRGTETPEHASGRRDARWSTLRRAHAHTTHRYRDHLQPGSETCALTHRPLPPHTAAGGRTLRQAPAGGLQGNSLASRGLGWRKGYISQRPLLL